MLTAAFGGALFATSSAAASTILYLYLSQGQPWAPRFIQLYSLVGMMSGWVNTAMMQAGPRHPLLHSKISGWMLLALTSAISLTLFFLLYGTPPSWLEISATISLASPVLYAAIYSGVFAGGESRWVYKRATIFNLLLLLGGAIAIPMGPSYESLCTGVSLAFPFIGLIFLLDPLPRPQFKADRPDYISAAVNPSMPVLERSVWDQWVLHRLSFEPFSWALYLTTRLITFGGNVLFSFFMGTQAFELTSRKVSSRISIYLLGANTVVFALACAIPGPGFAHLIFGSLAAWQISLLMAIFYQGPVRATYYLIGAAWLMTLLLRIASLRSWSEIHSYAFAQSISSWAIVSALYFWISRLGEKRHG